MSKVKQLTDEEVAMRVHDVFDDYFADGDIWVTDLGDGKVEIEYEYYNEDTGYAWRIGSNIEDLSDRPEALDYLLGKRDDYND